MRDFHRPVHRPAEVIEALAGGGDPAEASSLAHDTAAALLHRIHTAEDPDVVERLIAYADLHGIDDVAELWAAAPAVSLPGAMWRLYLIRHLVNQSREEASYLFRRGLEMDGGVNQAIAGSPSAPGPNEVVELATTILRGAFTGDFADALHRAGAFARVMALGSDSMLDGLGDAPGARQERRRGDGYRDLAAELEASARLWNEGQLR